MTKQLHRSVGLWLAIGVALVCLLTAGGSMTTTDAVIAYDVTRGLVERRSVALSEVGPRYDAYRGIDGRYYSPFGVAQSVWNVPFYLAGRAAGARIGGRLAADAIPKAAVALATVPAIALLALVCFHLLLRLGAAPLRASGTVLLMIFATPLWPYSGFGFNQPLAALFLWTAVLAAVASTARQPWPFVAGISVGLAILTRHEMIGAAIVLGVYLALQRQQSARTRAFASYSAGLLPMWGTWCALNWWRFGNPFESGYLRDETPAFGSSVLVGGAGLLFSPYASLFLYAPITILSAAGLRALWRRDRHVALLFLALTGGYFLLYASLGNWMGGRSYGPRYLVPFLPALVLPLAFWSPGPRERRLAGAVVLLSIAVQLPGVLVDYSKVRIERAAAGETVAQDNRWSRMPLILNARATIANGRRALAFLAGLQPAPRVHSEKEPLSTTLSFSLDLWWLYLAYLGVIGRAMAMAIAAFLVIASFASIGRSIRLASAHPSQPGLDARSDSEQQERR
jgi:hypothetical protein